MKNKGQDRLREEIYQVLYTFSVLSEGSVGVRILHEDEWPIDNLLLLFQKYAKT